jgi:hypothetical protein
MIVCANHLPKRPGSEDVDYFVLVEHVISGADFVVTAGFVVVEIGNLF